MKAIHTFIGAALLTECCLLPISSSGQAGTLDPSFGIGGVVTTDFGSSEDRGNSVVIQTDGKIVVAGWSSDTLVYDFALIRYNTDGSLDSSFGSDGKVATDFGGDSDHGSSVAIQANGKIVVAGSSGYNTQWDFALARYNSDGTLDGTFGSGGIVTTDFGSTIDLGNSVVIQTDGKIVLAGNSDSGITTYTDFALARYNTDGSLDSTFGSGGKVTTDFAGRDDESTSVAIQTDDKIVVTGRGDNGPDPDVALVRYNIDGSLDSSFGAGGTVTTAIGIHGDWGTAVAIQTDGKIVVAGFSEIGTDWDLALLRYNSDGSLDSTFGSGGIVTTDSADEKGSSLAIQADGKIVVAGHSGYGPDYDFALTRYDTDGDLDNTFGSGTIVTTSMGSAYDIGNSVVIQADGKIVLAGWTNTGTDYDFALARYNGDPVGVNETPTAQSLFVSPNPFTNELDVSSLGTGEIVIIDAMGKEILRQKVTPQRESRINTSSIAAGVYLLRFTDAQEPEHSATSKQVVKIVKL